MKRFNTKKLTAFVIASAVLAATAFTGCGKEEVDYSIDGSTEEGESSSGDGGELASRLGIPESYEGDIAVGDSGLKSITINDEDIETPSSDSMSIISYGINSFDSEYKQQVCEAVFDKSKGIYVYDWENLTKSDIEYEISMYESYLQSAQDDGDTDSAEYYEEMISDLEDELETAIDEREGAGDYSASDFIGYIGDYQFLLSFSDTEGEVGAYFELTYYPSEGLLDYKPYDGAAYVYEYDAIYGDEEYDDDSVNSCTLTEDEAISIAEDFLVSCGIEDVAVSSTSALLWEFYDTDYDVIATEYDGYVINFARSVNGTLPYTGDLSMVDTLTDDDTWYESLVETFYVEVDSNGVISATCNPLFTPTGDEEKNVDLLSWDELLDALNENVGEYFTENPTSYNNIEFNDVKLTYYCMEDESQEDIYIYTPVWIFAEAEEYDGEYDYEYPIQGIVVNAMDGTIYNLTDILTDGTTLDYSDYIIDTDDEYLDEDEYEIIEEDVYYEDDEDYDDEDYDDEDYDDEDYEDEEDY